MSYKILCQSMQPEDAVIKQYPSILEALDKERVFGFDKIRENTIRVSEGCDMYFMVHLTKSQLLALSYEIRELAEDL